MAVELQDRAGVAAGSAAASQAPRGSVARLDRWLLVAILLFALLLRLRGLNSFSFEQDELYTILEGRDLFAVDLAPGIDGRPLYYLLQHVLLGVLPITPVGLRIVPLIFGMLGVWATGLTASRVYGARAGLVAAFLVAIAPWHLHASTYARYWSLLYLLATVFFLNLWLAYRDENPRHYIAAAAALIAGSATHPSFLFAAFSASAGVSLIRVDGSHGLRLPSARAWRLLWLPYLLFLTGAFLALRWTSSTSALQNWGGRGAAASLRLIPAVVEWLGPAIAAAAFLGALSALTGGRERRSWGAMAFYGCAGALLLLLFASTRTDVYADYAFPMVPLVFISAAGLLYQFYERLTDRSGFTLGVATAVLAASVAPATASHLSSGTRFDYRPAFSFIRDTSRNTAVLTWPVIVARYYAPELDVRGLTMRTSYLDSLLVNDRDFWVVASITRYGMVVDDDNTVSNWLENNCTLRFSSEKSRWDYRVYRVNVHRCQAETPTAPATPARATASRP